MPLPGAQRGRYALAATAAVAALLAGCGDDNTASGGDGYEVDAVTTVTVATPRLTKPQFVAQVNAMCREAWVTILDNWDVHTGGQDSGLTRQERFVDGVRASLLAGIVFHIFDGIQNLGAPPGEQAAVEKIIGTQQSASERGQKGLAPVRSVDEVVQLYGDYNRLARRYGLDDCLVNTARLRDLEV